MLYFNITIKYIMSQYNLRYVPTLSADQFILNGQRFNTQAAAISANGSIINTPALSTEVIINDATKNQALFASIVELQGEISGNVNPNLVVVDSRLSALEGNVAILQGNVVFLQNEINDINSNVSGLNANTQYLRAPYNGAAGSTSYFVNGLQVWNGANESGNGIFSYVDGGAPDDQISLKVENGKNIFLNGGTTNIIPQSGGNVNINGNTNPFNFNVGAGLLNNTVSISTAALNIVGNGNSGISMYVEPATLVPPNPAIDRLDLRATTELRMFSRSTIVGSVVVPPPDEANGGGEFGAVGTGSFLSGRNGGAISVDLLPGSSNSTINIGTTQGITDTGYKTITLGSGGLTQLRNSSTFLKGDSYFPINPITNTGLWDGIAYIGLPTLSSGPLFGQLKSTYTPYVKSISTFFAGPTINSFVSGAGTFTVLVGIGAINLGAGAGGLTMTVGGGLMALTALAGGITATTAGGAIQLTSGAGAISATTGAGPIQLETNLGDILIKSGGAPGGVSGSTYITPKDYLILNPDLQVIVGENGNLPFYGNLIDTYDQYTLTGNVFINQGGQDVVISNVFQTTTQTTYLRPANYANITYLQTNPNVLTGNAYMTIFNMDTGNTVYISSSAYVGPGGSSGPFTFGTTDLLLPSSANLVAKLFPEVIYGNLSDYRYSTWNSNSQVASNIGVEINIKIVPNEIDTTAYVNVFGNVYLENELDSLSTIRCYSNTNTNQSVIANNSISTTGNVNALNFIGNAVVLANNTSSPALTQNALYNIAGNLYFNGNLVNTNSNVSSVNGLTHLSFPATTPNPFPLPSAFSTDSVVITSEISQNAGTGLIDLGCPVLGIKNEPVFSFCPPITVSSTLVIFFDNLNGAANFFNPQTNVWTMGVITFQSTANVSLQIFSACLSPAIGSLFPNQSLIVSGNFNVVSVLSSSAYQNNVNGIVSVDLTTLLINPLFDNITSTNGRLGIIAVATIPGGVNNYPTYATNGTQILFAYGGQCVNVSTIGGFGFYMVSSTYPQQTFIGGGPGGVFNNPPGNPNSTSAINTITYGPVLGLIFVGGSYINWNIGAGSGNITQYGSMVGYASSGTWNNTVSITQIGTPNNNWSGRLGIVQSNTDALGDFFFSGDFKCPIGALPVQIYSYPNANSYATNPYPTLNNPNTGAYSVNQITFSVSTPSTLSTITAQAFTGIAYVPILTNTGGQQQGINTPVSVWSYNATTAFIQSSNPVSGSFTINGAGFFARGINLYPYRVAAYTGIYVEVVNSSIPGGQVIYQSVPINIPQASQSNQPYYLEFNNPASGYDAYPLLVNGSNYYFNVLPTSQTLGNGWWYDDNGTQSDTTFFVCSTNYLTTGNGSTQTITLNPAIPLEVGINYTISFLCMDSDITGTQFMALDTTTSPGNSFFTSTGSQQSGTGLINIIDSAWVNYLNFSRPVQIPNMLGGIPSQPTISVCGTDLQHIYKCGWGLTPTPYTGTWVGENQYIFSNYTANTAQTTPPSSNGQIVWNTGTQSSATAIYVSTTDNSSINNTTQLLKCNTGDILLLQDIDGNYQEFQLTGSPVNNTTYITYNVALSQAVGSAFTNGEAVKITIYEFNAYQKTPVPIGVNGYYILARDTTVGNGAIYLQSGVSQAVAAYRFIPPIINTSLTFQNGIRFSLADSNITRTSNLISFINQASSITMTKSISDPTLWVLTAQSGNMGFASI
jgi:hypothetical protein